MLPRKSYFESKQKSSIKLKVDTSHNFLSFENYVFHYCFSVDEKISVLK